MRMANQRSGSRPGRSQMHSRLGCAEFAVKAGVNRGHTEPPDEAREMNESLTRGPTSA